MEKLPALRATRAAHGWLALVLLLTPGIAQATAPSADLADVVARVAPSVVSITSFRDTAESQAAGSSDTAGKSPAGKTGFGAGFVINASGIIVTNKHVIAGASGFTVSTINGVALPAHLLAVATHSDIALIQVDAQAPLRALSFADSDMVRVGDTVFTIGNPLGLSMSLSAGVVSALDRDIHMGDADRYMQTDTPINRGNSGGPLFNTKGEVVGVATALQSLTDEGGSIGLGFALPANDVRFVVDRLLKSGQVHAGWIGVKGQEMTPSLAAAVGLAGRRGIIVTGMSVESPGFRSGLRVGDVILKLAGRDITGLRVFHHAVLEQPIGSVVPLVVWRGDQEVKGQILILDWPDDNGTIVQSAALLERHHDSPNFGLVLSPASDLAKPSFSLAPYGTGVLVKSVLRDSDAADEGIRPGDVIVKVEQEAVSTPFELWRGVDQASRSQHARVLLLVINETELKWVALPIPGNQLSAQSEGSSVP